MLCHTQQENGDIRLFDQFLYFHRNKISFSKIHFTTNFIHAILYHLNDLIFHIDKINKYAEQYICLLLLHH